MALFPKIPNPWVAKYKTQTARHKRRGNILTFINLVAIVLIFMVVGPQLQKNRATYSQINGYKIAFNSLNFNNATLVELRTQLQDQPISSPYQLTFYDDEQVVASYPFIFPQDSSELVTEYALPLFTGNTVKAVFTSSSDIFTLTSKIKVMKGD